METKHAPGPWHTLKNNAGLQVASSSSLVVCFLKNCDKEHREANARLIATAPELLEALQALLGWEEAEIKHFGATGPDAWIMEMARAAIAKATTPNAD